MAMALPVYAEEDPLPDAPDEVELLEDEPGTASGEGHVFALDRLIHCSSHPFLHADNIFSKFTQKLRHFGRG